MRSAPTRLLLLLSLCATAACGTASTALDDEEEQGPGDPPTMSAIAGDYEATQFTANGEDVLALGATLSLTLGADGSVAGTLDVPPAAGGPFQADMAGTYTLSGNSLTIDQDADTFVRDATWTWSNGVLSGSWSGSSGSVSVTLER